MDSDTALSRTLPDVDGDLKLIDPAVYLWTLDPDTSEKYCAHLATLAWVPIELSCRGDVAKEEWLREKAKPVLDASWPPSPPAKDDDFERMINECLQWQVDLGATALLLPAPLIDMSKESLQSYLAWIDVGLRQATKFDLTTYVTVPISDSATRVQARQLLDQLTAREEIEGVYALVDMSTTSAPTMSAASAQFLIEISFVMGEQRGAKVIVNFADTMGLVCLAFGASGFCTGYENKARHLDAAEFVEREGGGAFPRFLSLATTTRLSLGDLKRFAENDLLDWIDGDRTPSSEGLLHSLEDYQQDIEALGTESDVELQPPPEWTESRSNVSAARRHQVERLRAAVEEIGRKKSTTQRVKWASRLLRDAEIRMLYLARELGDQPVADPGQHLGPWRKAVKMVVRKYSLT